MRVADSAWTAIRGAWTIMTSAQMADIGTLAGTTAAIVVWDANLAPAKKLVTSATTQVLKCIWVPQLLRKYVVCATAQMAHVPLRMVVCAPSFQLKIAHPVHSETITVIAGLAVRTVAPAKI